MKTSSQRRIRLLAMMRAICVSLIALLMTSALYGQDPVGTVTTYSALTSKNTSAALGSGSPSASGTPSVNVSKIPITSVLASGSGTRIFTHLPVWFGTSSHQDVGYSSVDANQVQRQVADVVSRGISGVIINWRGPFDFTDQAALLVMREAETQNLEFAIEVDAREFAQCAGTQGCDLSASVVHDLTYIQSTYSASSKYLKYQGRAVIFLYGMDTYQLDWTKIRASFPGDPILVFRAAAVASAPNVTMSALESPVFENWTPGQYSQPSGLRWNHA